MADRTPAIIACMRDMVTERCDKSEDADLLVAHAALTIAIDQSRTFELWPITGDDENLAVDLLRAIDGHERPFESNRSACGAVARCLSEVACALFVQGGDEKTSEWLHGAAGRMIGCSTRPAKCTYEGRLSDALAEVVNARADLDSMTEQRDEALRQLAELRREIGR